MSTVKKTFERHIEKLRIQSTNQRLSFKAMLAALLEDKSGLGYSLSELFKREHEMELAQSEEALIEKYRVEFYERFGNTMWEQYGSTAEKQRQKRIQGGKIAGAIKALKSAERRQIVFDKEAEILASQKTPKSITAKEIAKAMKANGVEESETYIQRARAERKAEQKTYKS